MSYAKAVSKYMRVSPQKARLAAGLIRGLSASEALAQLQYCQLKGGRLLKKTLDSAIANAEVQLDLRPEQMKVVEVRVDEGPRLKRTKPRNKGGRHPFMRRTSHFTVVVSKE